MKFVFLWREFTPLILSVGSQAETPRPMKRPYFFRSGFFSQTRFNNSAKSPSLTNDIRLTCREVIEAGVNLVQYEFDLKTNVAQLIELYNL